MRLFVSSLHTGRQIIDSPAVKEMFSELKSDNLPAAMQIHIQQADPAMYNQLFTNQGASWITLN
jgi:hypothetical protein